MGTSTVAAFWSHNGRVGWSEFNAPSQRKYGYIRDDTMAMFCDNL